MLPIPILNTLPESLAARLPFRAPREILTPRHVHPHVNTEDDYRLQQRRALDQRARLFMNLQWLGPWASVEKPAVFIAGGVWLTRCACGNAPVVAPEWRGLACCYECGAIYERLELPAKADEIERLLVARPDLQTRNWRQGETVADLHAENRAHGIGV